MLEVIVDEMFFVVGFRLVEVCEKWVDELFYVY